MLTIENEAIAPKRSVWQPLTRGLRCRCPACGEGRLFGRYTKTVRECSACGEELFHHRADDMPPYVVMTITGHFIVWGILVAELDFAWPIWAHVAVWPLATILFSLALLQPVKGAIIGLQWALRMHGFGGISDEEAMLQPKSSRDRP